MDDLAFGRRLLWELSSLAPWRKDNPDHLSPNGTALSEKVCETACEADAASAYIPASDVRSWRAGPMCLPV